MKVNAISAIIIGAAVVVLAGCATAEKKAQEAGYAAMTQADLEQFYSRTRHGTWRNPNGSSGTMTYNADGTASVDWGSGADEGRWRIVGDQFCSQWKTVRSGVETCTRMYRVSDSEFHAFSAGGNLHSRLTYEP